MKVVIQKIPDVEEEEIVVRCHDDNSALLALVADINRAADGISAYRGSELFKLDISDIFYFEVVENKSFVYCEKEVYECKMRLYEFEKLSANFGFFRATKSTVINAEKIVSVAPSISGRFFVKFTNGEKAVVSRGYVSALKKAMGL